MEPNDVHRNQTYSYLALRKAIGWIGILLPFTLMIGFILIFNGDKILRTISNYYYTGMRDVFVGAICSIALFLFFYRGHNSWDNWVGNIAGFFALGIAFFPTAETGPNNLIGIIHFYCAAGFFLTLAGFSIFLFTKKDSNPTREKLTRNKIYVICGLVMIFCLSAIMIFYNFIHNIDKSKSSFVFWAETVALVAFGVSWLTKGGTLYPDEKEKKKDNIKS